ncbi:hypothetical protein ABEF95_001715 [Exophiala dermatitidis]
MAEVHSAFQFDSAPHKRKRRLAGDVSEDLLFGRDPKRRATHSLPIRVSPPSRPQVSVPPAFSMFTSIYQQPPTPVDTSDDESPGHPRDHHYDSSCKTFSTAFQQQPNCNDQNRGARSRNFSPDVEMDLSPIAGTQARVRRARSNDIIGPYRDSNFLSSTINACDRERVPTPISCNFDHRVNDLPSVPRHHFPPLRTNLSPMIEQESWINRDGLPSPTEDQDQDTAMLLDHNNNGSGSRHVTRNGGFEPQSMERHMAHLEGSYSPGRTRTAKLHMGFLQGCEKCLQKVPGHYSHILWT